MSLAQSMSPVHFYETKIKRQLADGTTREYTAKSCYIPKRSEADRANTKRETDLKNEKTLLRAMIKQSNDLDFLRSISAQFTARGGQATSESKSTPSTEPSSTAPPSKQLLDDFVACDYKQYSDYCTRAGETCRTINAHRSELYADIANITPIKRPWRTGDLPEYANEWKHELLYNCKIAGCAIRH